MRTFIVTISIFMWCYLMCVQHNAAQMEIYQALTYSENDTETVKIQEVDYGKNALLKCRSNDKKHFFQYWQLPKNDSVVGPGNKYDASKYDFEVLKGNLIVRKVSSDEEGLYHCVSKGVINDNINIRSVHMIVKKDLAEVDAHDSGLNYFRGVVVIISLLVIAVVIYFAYRLRRRHRLQSLLDASDEDDSGDEIFRAPGTSNNTRNIVLDKSEDEEEVPKITIEFDDILKNSHSK